MPAFLRLQVFQEATSSVATPIRFSKDFLVLTIPSNRLEVEICQRKGDGRVFINYLTRTRVSDCSSLQGKIDGKGCHRHETNKHCTFKERKERREARFCMLLHCTDFSVMQGTEHQFFSQEGARNKDPPKCHYIQVCHCSVRGALCIGP